MRPNMVKKDYGNFEGCMFKCERQKSTLAAKAYRLTICHQGTSTLVPFGHYYLLCVLVCLPCSKNLQADDFHC